MQTVTIRWSIFRNLLLLVGVIAIAISAATLIIGDRSAQQISKQMISRTSDLATASIEPIFDNVRKSLLLFRKFGYRGLLQPENPLVMNLMFMPFMTDFPEVSSINTGDAAGRGYLLLRTEDGWANRIVEPESVGKVVYWMDWDRDGQLQREYMRDIDYDPRRRPWYELAAKEPPASDSVVWTSPYRFYTTQDIGITAAVTVSRPGSNPYVLAFDLLLTDLSRITAQLAPSHNGLVSLLTEDGRVLGLPREMDVGDLEAVKQLLLQPVDKLGIPQLAQAFEDWRRASRSIFHLQTNGKGWWVNFRRIELTDGGPSLLLAVMVPEEDFMGDVYQNQLFIWLITIVALGLALLMAVLLARNYGRPLERLVSESEQIQNLELESTQPIESNLREVEYLADAHSRMKTVLGSFAKYVPVDIVRMLLARGEAARLGGVNKAVTVLFTDIQGFTSVAEAMTPEALTRHMGDYFHNMLVVLKEEHATIDKFVGDAIVAFWNAPNNVPDHAAHAVAAALRCSARLVDLNALWRENGLPELPTRFGINTGPVVVGNIGAESRLNYTVLGDTVNLASRLEGLNRLYGTTILVSDQVRQEIGNQLLWRHVDRVAVKGKLQGVDVFEPLGKPGDVHEDQRLFAREYEAALTLHLQGEFREALAAFTRLRQDHPGDLSVQLMITSCETLVANPPEAWDGVRRLELK